MSASVGNALAGCGQQVKSFANSTYNWVRSTTNAAGTAVGPACTAVATKVSSAFTRVIQTISTAVQNHRRDLAVGLAGIALGALLMVFVANAYNARQPAAGAGAAQPEALPAGAVRA